jgi:hypothetical protein
MAKINWKSKKQVREYQLSRYYINKNNPDFVKKTLEYARKYRADPEYRKKHDAYYKKWYRERGRPDRVWRCATTEAMIEYNEKHPERIKARQLVDKEIVAGRMVRPKKCSRCGLFARVHGHHEDYNKPLEVIWLCASCHKKEHNNRRKVDSKVEGMLH